MSSAWATVPVIANPDPLKVGTETIYDNGGTDTIRFGAGIDPQNMKFANGGSVGFPPDLLIDYANPSSANVDRLLITDGQLGNIEYFEVTQVDGAIRKFSFTDFVGNYAAGMLSANEANGTRHVTAGKGNDFVTAGGSANSLLSGGAGNDTVVGGSGNDLLDGGTGNDRLSGDAGNDIYLFSAGDGHDEIDQVSSNSGDLDVVRFTDDVVPDDVSLSRNGDDLVLSLASGADTISLANWFSEGDVPARVSSVEFADGTVWDEQAIIDAVGNSSGSGVIEGSAGDDTLTGTSAAEEIRGLAGNDILIGGAGDDVLIGGAGSDLYRFTSGDDNDTVNEAAGESNVLELGAGITAADLSFEQTELGLVVRYAAADSVLLAGYDGSEDMTLRFADGSEVRLAELANRAPVSRYGPSRYRRDRGYGVQPDAAGGCLRRRRPRRSSQLCGHPRRRLGAAGLAGFRRGDTHAVRDAGQRGCRARWN
jgi:Ca2+-binding RTX toxin-like protein